MVFRRWVQFSRNQIAISQYITLFVRLHHYISLNSLINLSFLMVNSPLSPCILKIRWLNSSHVASCPFKSHSNSMSPPARAVTKTCWSDTPGEAPRPAPSSEGGDSKCSDPQGSKLREIPGSSWLHGSKQETQQYCIYYNNLYIILQMY